MELEGIFTVILVVCLSSIGCSQTKKVKKFIDQYERVAHWDFDGKTRPILKWPSEDTIYYGISGGFKYMNAKGWSNFIAKVEQASGLKVKETNDLDDAQIKIYFSSLPDYFVAEDIRYDGLGNLTFKSWNNRKYSKNYFLTSASYCLDPSRINDSRYGKYLLQKCFLNAIGLLGELDDEYSLFTSTFVKINYKLSKRDMRFVKLHYSSLVDAGQEEIKITDYGYIESLLKEKFK